MVCQIHELKALDEVAPQVSKFNLTCDLIAVNDIEHTGDHDSENSSLLYKRGV